MNFTFSIITPCLNSEKYISETIESVIFQKSVISGRFDLEYIICDGGSMDGTLDIIRSYMDNNKRKNISIRLISENDSGMYEALAKGLNRAGGNICAYLNADDFYSLDAFEIVAELFSKHQVKWLTGLSVIYNAYSHVVRCRLPFKYRKRFFECGFYGRRLPFVQQEVTFWHSSLNRLIDMNRLSGFKLAGDFYLWKIFSQQSQLHIVEAYLGGFRIHPGQLTSEIMGYLNEARPMCRRPGFADYGLLCGDYILWKAPPGLKKIFNKSGLFRFNHENSSWE